MKQVQSSLADTAYSLWRDLRIRVIYFYRHGRLPNLDHPQTFTERIQDRKRFDRDPRLPRLSDKIEAKTYAANRLGEDWILPNLWTGTVLPNAPDWPMPSVLKSSHGWNQIAFLKDSSQDWRALQRLSQRWLKKTHGLWLDEWAYTQIPPRLLVEPYIGDGDILPIDYKFYVFGGEVTLIQVHLARGQDHRWMLFDRDWTRISRQTHDHPKAPPCLPEMIIAAETLARGFDFVRVDLYEFENKPLFGEMTFYPGSGYDRFDPVSLDWTIGKMWRDALLNTEPASKGETHA